MSNKGPFHLEGMSKEMKNQQLSGCWLGAADPGYNQVVLDPPIGNPPPIRCAPVEPVTVVNISSRQGERLSGCRLKLRLGSGRYLATKNGGRPGGRQSAARILSYQRNRSDDLLLWGPRIRMGALIAEQPRLSLYVFVWGLRPRSARLMDQKIRLWKTLKSASRALNFVTPVGTPPRPYLLNELTPCL